MEADDSCEDTVSVLSDSTEEQIDDSSAIRSKRKNGESTKNGPASKKKRKNELYKPPTVEELNSLKETENLFNNNLFRLQIQEIITEVTIKNKRRKHLSEWTLSFEKFLETLPDYEVSLSELNKPKKKGNQSKFCTKLAQYETIFETDQDVELKFLKPASFEKFGLYENGSLPGPNLITNINLIIPKSCFAPKDFLNNRYLTKRYYYLTYIAEHLKKSELVTTLKISFHEENHLLPIIELTPSGCDKTTMFIYVTPEETTFKPARFLPLQNNIKLDVFKMTVDIDILKNSPTIFYNSAIAHDATLSLNNRFIAESLKDQSNIQDGVKLLCIWLKQRELNIGQGSFTENLILYIIVYLVSKKKINKYMSSYQVVRNFWSFISSTDLQNEPISIGETTTDVLSDFKKYFDIVLVDCTGCYNLASFLNLDIYKKVKLECQSALQLLDDNKHNTFHQLFLTRCPFHLQFDLVIDLTESLPLEQENSEQEKALYAGYADLLKCNNVLKIIKKALNKRAFVLVPRIEIDHRIIKSFIIGANLNPDEAYNFLETGPALSDYGPAEEFRKFWGHLSSDRRFRDGSTNVAVHFKTNTIRGKRNIIKKILDYIFNEKLRMKYTVYYDEFEEVLLSKKLVPSYPSGSNEETTFKIIHSSDELGKKLRALQMSLKITGVQGIDNIPSFTEVFPPIPCNYKVGSTVTAIQGNSLIFSDKKIGLVPRFVQPIECVLQLEHSSKWPNDLDALRFIKTTFYLEISKMLQSQHQIMSHVTKDFIEILYAGLVFRYRLYVPKEIGLMKRAATETGVAFFRESADSFEMEKTLNIMPKIVGALKGIQSQHPSYGPGTALVKRWLRSQLIDSYHISDIVINLLNASLYLNDTSQPNTPQMSFLRCLKLLSEFDWNLHAITVNFNDELSSEEILEFENRSQTNREAYPNAYIINPFDQGSSVFTKPSPSKEILLRIKQLSLETLSVVSKVITERNAIDVKSLFIPNFDGYNVLIHLRPLLNPRRHEQFVGGDVESRMVIEKYKPSEDDKFPIVNFNPVETYLRTLRENYSRFAVFFHDTYGGNVIGVLWRPKVYEEEDFKVTRVNAGKIVGNKVHFNMDAVIEDFFILGNDLVKTIEKR